MTSSRYKKIKVGSIRRKKIIILFIIISLLFISGGYSILNSELGFSGTLIVNKYNSNDAIRIANVELIDKKNNGNEINKPNYSSNLTNMNVNLPNTNSSVTYRITIKNNTGSYFTPGEIKTITNTNANVRYAISGLESYGVYQGDTYTFDITFTTSSTNQSGSVTIKFDFQIIETTVWTFDYTGGEQSIKTPYNATYKLEVWGAQGGTITNTLVETTYYGGYGGYSVGEVRLNANTNLYINVGGEGKSCLNYGSTIAGTRTCGDDGGYNGGGSTRQYVSRTYYGSGGGATHIATVTGLLSDLEPYKGTYSDSNGTYDSKDILIVAGGGGGASSYAALSYAAHGGAGGGYIGANSEPIKVDRDVYCTPGTQTEAGGGSDSGNMGFGRGADITRYVGPGAGGGWYGGGSSELFGCGGSSYIGSSKLTNKAMYCYNCEPSTNTHTKTFVTTDVRDSPKANCAKKGNGYAKITIIPAN